MKHSVLTQCMGNSSVLCSLFPVHWAFFTGKKEKLVKFPWSELTLSDILLKLRQRRVEFPSLVNQRRMTLSLCGVNANNIPNIMSLRGMETAYLLSNKTMFSRILLKKKPVLVSSLFFPLLSGRGLQDLTLFTQVLANFSTQIH
jgi:hypothetical protein